MKAISVSRPAPRGLDGVAHSEARYDPAIAVPEEAMEMAFTAVFKKVPEGYVAFVEELAGANTQGATLEEARENLREAVEMVLEANRAIAREETGTGDVIRERLKIAG